MPEEVDRRRQIQRDTQLLELATARAVAEGQKLGSR
jgi:hypothetical protein